MEKTYAPLTDADRTGMWCDNFDMDLLKVFPGVDRWFTRAPIVMWTLCRPTNGKINCPAAWWGAAGGHCLGSFVFVQHWSPTYRRDESGWVNIGGYTTDDQWVMCTPLELVRDLWVHNNRTVLAHQHSEKVLGILKADLLARDFQAIMGAVRGYGNREPSEVADARYRCLRRLWNYARIIRRAANVSEWLRITEPVA